MNIPDDIFDRGFAEIPKTKTVITSYDLDMYAAGTADPDLIKLLDFYAEIFPGIKEYCEIKKRCDAFFVEVEKLTYSPRRYVHGIPSFEEAKYLLQAYDAYIYNSIFGFMDYSELFKFNPDMLLLNTLVERGTRFERASEENRALFDAYDAAMAAIAAAPSFARIFSAAQVDPQADEPAYAGTTEVTFWDLYAGKRSALLQDTHLFDLEARFWDVEGAISEADRDACERVSFELARFICNSYIEGNADQRREITEFVMDHIRLPVFRCSAISSLVIDKTPGMLATILEISGETNLLAQALDAYQKRQAESKKLAALTESNASRIFEIFEELFDERGTTGNIRVEFLRDTLNRSRRLIFQDLQAGREPPPQPPSQ